jgi:hypothetical protein
MVTKIGKKLVILAILIFVACGFGYAQEKEASVDNSGKIFVIDAALRDQVGLFKEYPGFKEARLFEVSENEFLLEIYYKPESQNLRKRITLSAAEVMELRDKITTSLKGQLPESALDQSGRVKLLITSTAAGLGYYGWAIPIALHMKSGKAIASTYMLTGALSFYVPFALTKNSPVTDAAGNAYFYGTTRGAVHGVVLNTLIYGNDYSYRRAFGFSVLGSIGEAAGFYKLSSANGWSTGKVELLGVGGDFGMLNGWLAPFAFNFDGKNRGEAGSILLGAGAGFAVAARYSQLEHITQGDAYALRASGVMGAYTSFSVIDLIRPKNERWYARTFMAGTLGGLYLGHTLVHEKDFTPAQGIFIEIGQLAGWLTGLGVAYLIRDPEITDNSRLFSSLSAVGGITGYTLMYRSFSDKAHQKATKSSWNIHLMPQNYFVSRLSGVKRQIPMPLAALDIKF